MFFDNKKIKLKFCWKDLIAIAIGSIGITRDILFGKSDTLETIKVLRNSDILVQLLVRGRMAEHVNVG